MSARPTPSTPGRALPLPFPVKMCSFPLRWEGFLPQRHLVTPFLTADGPRDMSTRSRRIADVLTEISEQSVAPSLSENLLREVNENALTFLWLPLALVPAPVS